MNWLPLFLLAQIDIGEITPNEGIAIRHCHTNDTAFVEVVGHGMFTTDERLMTLKSPPMTMIPNGTNIAHIQTICRGMTSEVAVVQFVIRRPVPAPRVGRGTTNVTLPPMPPGFVMPLPNSRWEASYEAFRRSQSGMRRSQ